MPVWRYPVSINASYGHGGLVCGVWNDGEKPEILARTKTGVLILDRNGKPRGLINVGEDTSALALCRTPHGPLLIGFEVWSQTIEAYDVHGKSAWSYHTRDAIDWATTVAIGDPQGDAVAIGFNGDAGITLLDAQGRFLWNAKGPTNVWSVGKARLSRTAAQSVVGIGPENSIVTYDLHGALIRSMKPFEVEAVFGADLDNDGIDEVFGLGQTISSGGYLYAYNADGNLRFQRRADYGTSFAVGRFLPSRTQVAVGSGNGNVYLFGAQGELLPGLKVSPDVIALATLAGSGSQDSLIALTSSGIVCYQWNPDKPAGKPVLPEQDKTDNDFPETPFVRAVQQNRLAEVRTLLEQGADPNTKNSQGSPVLVVAANRGFTEMAQLLLEKGAKVDARRKDGDTALLVALGAQHDAIALLLIQKGADVNTKYLMDGIEFSVLLSAVMDDQAEVVEALLKAGASVDFTERQLGRTALFWTDKVEIARMLLDHGAKVDARDWTGNTPLMLAVQESRLAMAQLLVERGANVNARTDAAREKFLADQLFRRRALTDSEQQAAAKRLAVRHDDGTSVLEIAQRRADIGDAAAGEILALLKRAGAH